MTIANILNTESCHTARFQRARKIHLFRIKQARLVRNLIGDDYVELLGNPIELPKYEKPETDWTKGLKGIYHLIRGGIMV